MTDETDFSREDVVTPEVVPPEVEPDEDRPVIVIEYRNRNWLTRLIPPLIIPIAALAITSYQRTTPLRPVHLDFAPPARAVVPGGNEQRQPEPDPPVSPPAATTLDVTPEVETTRAEAPSQTAPVVVALAEPSRSRSPFDLEPVDGLVPMTQPPGPRPEPMPLEVEAFSGNVDLMPELGQDSEPANEARSNERAATAEAAEAGLSKEEILRDIAREAAEKEAQRQDLEELKPRARGLLLGEALEQVHAARIPFRNDLREVLRTLGKEAGPEIERLCNQYGREPLMEVLNAYYRRKRSMPPRTSRSAEVEMMRAVGLPEPVILDYLSHALDKTINTPGGPRDQHEVRVRAARLLLTFPVTATRPPAAPSLKPATDTGASARAHRRQP